MDVFPAIDLRAGRCVRLSEGDFERETVYGDDPVAVAEGFAATGARWVHVVDLDAARTGEATNAAVVARIARVPGIRVQTGGGVRSLAAAGALLDAGVSRVVVGTAAVEHPELVGQIAQRWPGAVAVGLDHRDGEVRLRGWTAGGGRLVIDLVPEAVSHGAAAVIVTDIGRDGMMVGPDLIGLAALLAATGAPIIASGGVATASDLAALADLRRGEQGLVGVIVGKALYEGRFTLPQAFAAAGRRDGPG
jgi:phosphoribosylformimino-5-aminoimidazole carboxamide ribotide isomerase